MKPVLKNPDWRKPPLWFLLNSDFSVCQALPFSFNAQFATVLRKVVPSTDASSCIYISDSYTDDFYRTKGVEMKCILIDSKQRYLELGEQRVEDLFKIEHKLLINLS
ncbi:hypothetical protein LC608_23830 [Nostoc sp. XA010]|uniref:hypothetical protein n=1 Tax=Nostoc sp. XA010 TaxID=2780407 RepID=UPI001E34BC96|nr:hypothetical protein [Nostoc sp. XA010]MCC5659952.1 hypothetical protein [Nostoc sp. XA010]